MKKIYGLTLILILFLFWLLLNSDNNSNQSPHVVSQQNQMIHAVRPEADYNTTSINAIDNQVAATADAEHAQNNRAKEDSYLQLYQDFRLSEFCPFDHFDKELSLQTIKQQSFTSLEAKNSSHNINSNDAQFEVHEQFIDACYVLHKKYHAFAPELPTNKFGRKQNEINLYLSHLLLTEPTETEKEKQLKNLRSLEPLWDNNWSELMQVAQGKTDNNNPEVIAILDQLAEVRAAMQQQNQLKPGEVPNESMMLNLAAVFQLQRQLELLQTWQSEPTGMKLKELQQQAEKIRVFLHLNDADLYFEAMALLNGSRKMRFINADTHLTHFKGDNLEKLGIPYQNEAMLLMSETGVLYSRNFKSLSPYATLLFICTLSQDCGADSITMQMYCLGLDYPKSFPEACNKDLPGFYFEDYLSTNQQQDVAVMFKQMLEIYGS